MAEKKCNHCRITQPEDNYHWANKRIGRRNSRCKSCCKNYYLKNDGDKRIRNKPYNGNNYHSDYYEKTADGNQHVYLLPEEKYIGTTRNPIARERHHKSSMKRNTDGFRVLYSTPNREEALELEQLLHDMGYKGKHTNNSYK